MEPLYVFLIVGQVQLAAFKGTHNVLRSPPPCWPAWGLTEPGHSIMSILFTISGVCYVFTIIYGFVHFVWWIPLIAIVILFPFAFYLLIRPITGDIFPMTVGTLLSVAGAAWVAGAWFF